MITLTTDESSALSVVRFRLCLGFGVWNFRRPWAGGVSGQWLADSQDLHLRLIDIKVGVHVSHILMIVQSVH